ncbi:Myosin-IIIb [Tupaia chinensis]|uniref:Myosin-IIIb n=1 Tax=Tupaia chinensis TaxID=246437 RepID=L9L8X6_TUPCH|nr:Myosin-IIIb [Tupaia chinensis]
MPMSLVTQEMLIFRYAASGNRPHQANLSPRVVLTLRNSKESALESVGENSIVCHTAILYKKALHQFSPLKVTWQTLLAAHPVHRGQEPTLPHWARKYVAGCAALPSCSENGLAQKQRTPRRRCQQPKTLSSPEDTMYYNQLNVQAS